MGILLSTLSNEFAVALALAFVVALVVLMAWFMRACVPLAFAVPFLILPAFVALAVARIERSLPVIMIS